MNKKLALSVLSTAVLTSMAASAFAAPVKTGYYIGGSVEKYYSIDAFLDDFDGTLEDIIIGFNSAVYVDDQGKAAKFKEALFAKDPNSLLTPATRDMFDGNSYKVVGGEEGAVWNPATHEWDDVVVPGDLVVESVSAITKTKVQVKFNKAVDSISSENFTVAGGVVNSATLSEDKKTVTLAVSGLNYETEYTLVTKQVLIDGKEVDLPDTKFKTPAITDLYTLELTTNKPGDAIRASTSENLVLTAKLISKETGKPDTNADNVVIEFKATYGNFANERVTVQNGEASVVFTSIFSQKDLVSKIDAQIIEASGDYKDLIGEVVGTKNIYIKLKLDDIDPDAKPALVSANSDQADRITAFFNKEVSVADFVEFDEETGKFKVDDDGNAILKTDKTFKKQVKIEVSQDEDFKETETKVIRGLKTVPGNPKALEIILNKADGNELHDNKEVYVRITQPSNVGDQVTHANFILEDTRKPEATSAVAEDLTTVKVKFSKPISSAIFTIDGGLVEVAKHEFKDFNAETLEDERDILVIKTKDYLKAGTHSIQLAEIVDFAGRKDKNNVSHNQSLDFKVDADLSAPTATVSVESPEKYRVNFNKKVKGLDAYGNQVALTKNHVKLQVLVGGTWTDVSDVDYKKEPKFKLRHVSDSEYVVEMEDDWTEIYDTKGTNKNYYNDKYRLFIAAETVINPANGKKNSDIVLLLNDPIMTAPDTTSPKIVDVKQVKGKVDEFNVVMSKPVKIPDLHETEDITHPQGKQIPNPEVQFVGYDKDGKFVTVKGKITKYTTDDHKDKEITVVSDDPNKATFIQDTVNNGGSEKWKIIIRSISDDIGNTAETLEKEFTVKPNVEIDDSFKVFVGDDKKAAITGKTYEKKDTIDIVFTSDVQLTGSVGNALSPSNFTVNGVKLPERTLITFTESGPDADKKKITITLPGGTLLDTSNTITLSKDLKSAKGVQLSGPNQFAFSAQDAKGVDKVEDAISALPPLSKLIFADKAQVDAAKDMFDNLTDSKKALVKNKSVLDAAVKKIADLEKAEQEAGENLTAAKEAVELLEEAAKDLSDEAKLIAAEEALKDAKAKVKKVTDAAEKKLLDAKVAYAEQKIQKARADFDKAALDAANDAVKALENAVKEDLKVKANLEAAEAALQDAVEKIKAVADGSEKTNLKGKIAAAEKTIEKARKDFDDAAAEALQKAIKEANDAIAKLPNPADIKKDDEAGADDVKQSDAQAAVDKAEAKVEAAEAKGATAGKGNTFDIDTTDLEAVKDAIANL